MVSSRASTAAAALLLVAPVSRAMRAIRSRLFTYAAFLSAQFFDRALQNRIGRRRRTELAFGLIDNDVGLEALGLQRGAGRVRYRVEVIHSALPSGSFTSSCTPVRPIVRSPMSSARLLPD